LERYLARVAFLAPNLKRVDGKTTLARKDQKIQAHLSQSEKARQKIFPWTN